MSAVPPPPPRRSAPPAPGPAPDPGWKGRMKMRGSSWGKKAVDKSVVISDSLGGRVNSIAERRFGTHAFWPVTGDFGREMDKCAQILREFTVEGVMTVDKKSKVKVIRKIPPSVIAEARGLAIFTSMRSGIAPFGGAGGAGVVVARLPDGSWSAPASISPNNISAGFLLGVDVYDCVLVIRTQEALNSFGNHKVTIGSEIGVAAGPYGIGAALEAGKERAPVFSYVKSRGVYAGLEVVGQVFVSRFEENGLMYHWPSIQAKDILEGKVKVPPEGRDLVKALAEAASGVAQAKKGEPLDVPIDVDAVAAIDLEEGEVLKLPPTPEMTDGHECEDDSETEKIIHRSHPPVLPPRHGHTQRVPPRLPPRNPARGGNRPSLDLIDMDEDTKSEPAMSIAENLGSEGERDIKGPPSLPPRSKDRPASAEVVRVAGSSTDLPPDYDAAAVPVEQMGALSVGSASSSLAVPDLPSPASSYGSNLPSPYESGGGAVLEDDFTAARHVALPAGSVGTSELHTPLDSPDAVDGVPAKPSRPEEDMTESERREWEQHLADYAQRNPSPDQKKEAQPPLPDAREKDEEEDSLR